jgi:predicted Zn-dependent peptidase
MKKYLFLTTLLFSSVTAQASIYLDLEEEPLPLIDLQIVLPIGFEAKAQNESGAASLLSDIFESGTKNKTRQEWLDALGAYGAEFDFSTSNQFSYININFPVVEGKNYDGLIDLFSEVWNSPRITNESFDLARTKLLAALTSSLDSDEGLAAATARRWTNRKAFGGFPVFIDTVSALNIETVQKVFDRDFKKSPDIWAGAVAPKSTLPLLSKMLKKIFTEQGSVVTGKRWQALKASHSPKNSIDKASKTLLLIDKSGRNQSVTTLMSFAPKKLAESSELAFLFGNHILTDGGLGAYMPEEIRTKRGLAYSVSGVSHQYLGSPVLGFSMNPVKEKSQEAFEVASQMIESSYVKGSLFEELPQDFWDRQWNSFKYEKILGQSTAGERLAERMAVIVGSLSSTLAESQPSDWKVTRSEVKKLFSELYNQSFTVAAVVGNAKELKATLEKNFKGFEIKVIPYKESILSKTYN